MKKQIGIFATFITIPLLSSANCNQTVETAIADLKKSCTKPITFLITAAPGGGSDKMIRDVSQQLGKLGLNAIVENAPSANGHVAAKTMQQNSDPCKFLVTSNSNISLNMMNPNLRPSVDPQKEFEPVSLLSTAPFVLAVNKNRDGAETNESRKMTDAPSLISAVKQDSLFYGSAGYGSFSHILGSKLENDLLTNGGETLLDTSNTSATRFDTHVPYVGSSAGSLAMIRGEVSYYFESPTTIYKTYKTRPKDIVILGATSEKPIKIVERDEKGNVKKSHEIPSLKQNYPKLKDFVALPYIGILATKGAASKNKSSLQTVVSCVIDAPKFKDKYEDLGYVIGDGKAESLASVMSEYGPDQKWGKAFASMLAMEKAQDATYSSKPTKDQAKPNPSSEVNK